MNLSPVIIAIPFYFILMGMEILALRFLKQGSYRINDTLTNINLGVLSQVTGIFLKILSIGVYTFIFEFFSVWEIENSVWTFCLLFILYDFCYYWAHRLSHEINLFWGGHVVHHSSEEYNLSVALRQSSTQTIWTFIFYLPLAVIGFDPVMLVLVSGINLLYQFWIHTETIGKMGWLENILNTPSHHRVHHGRNPKYIDKNHGGTFIIFDKWFGTFAVEEETPVYGITTPVNSWNPVRINLSHYAFMIKELKQLPAFRDRLRYIFFKPGWLPDSMGGYRKPGEIIGNEVKFNIEYPKKMNKYILFQYIFLLAFTAFFLFNTSKISLVEIVIGTSLIIWGTISFSGIFEMYRMAFLWEIIRLVSFSCGIYFFAFGYIEAFYLFTIIVLYFAISSLWLINTYRYTTEVLRAG